MVSDVLIAGGGPAGLTAAVVLQKQGWRVTVVDCAVPPIDKACGEGLMPDSLAALRNVGVDIPDDAGYPFRGIRFFDKHSAVSGHFPRGGTGMGIRRTRLHGILASHARERGVRTIWGAKHVRLCDGGLSIDGETLAADLVIGADGHNSAIRQAAGLGQTKSERKRFGFRRHYRVAPWSDYVELYWGPRGQIYVTPVAGDEVCVAFMSRDPKLRLDEALADFPAVVRQLAGAPYAAAEMGAMSISRRLRRVYNGKVVLLGDASGSVDAMTGEGMCLAFKQAGALAEALARDDLRYYAAKHREIGAKPHFMASVLLTLEEHRGLQRGALAGLAKWPAIFESLLRFHVGEALWAA